MRSHEIDGRPYILINGKTFFLLRGYCIKYDKWVFIQVYGTAPLTKDDLPEKNWQLLVTRVQGKRVFTAWKPGYFDGSNDTQLVLAITFEAGLRRVLRSQLSTDEAERLLPACIDIDTYTNRPRVHHETGITMLEDKGASGIPAFHLDRPYAFESFVAKRKEAACPQ